MCPLCWGIARDNSIISACMHFECWGRTPLHETQESRILIGSLPQYCLNMYIPVVGFQYCSKAGWFTHVQSILSCSCSWSLEIEQSHRHKEYTVDLEDLKVADRFWWFTFGCCADHFETDSMVTTNWQPVEPQSKGEDNEIRLESVPCSAHSAAMRLRVQVGRTFGQFIVVNYSIW